jgi:putative transposase
VAARHGPHRTRARPVERDFTAERSDERWVADISEFKCRDGKLYLAGIKDLHDRGLAGWSMGERQTTDLVVARW